ncbi:MULTISPECIES: ribonuclease P protein component [Eubacterium]|uniref:Ribonuclease P protein component n=1 Tax=Eubacterium barkeri TaxID=1528 RepID=A0A1H3F6X8_EUBBA|nr:ribonuclease P protein component [Eubacterium barkeri]SDX85944.1 ribonuclease P protein component [Eubacterium barkeri]
MKSVSLRKQKDFDGVFNEKNVFGNRHFTLFYKKNGESFNRIGIIVSKKISKKAVCRNRLRRQIKESFRQRQVGVKTGYDLIIIAKARCLNDAFSDLDRSLDHLFYKTKLKK